MDEDREEDRLEQDEDVGLPQKSFDEALEVRETERELDAVPVDLDRLTSFERRVVAYGFLLRRRLDVINRLFYWSVEIS